MDKKQSMAIKGVAIIMMVIYHLFYVAIQHGYEVNNLIYRRNSRFGEIIGNILPSKSLCDDYRLWIGIFI